MNLADFPPATRPQIAARLAELDGSTDRAAIEKLRQLTLRLAELALEAEQLAEVFPCLQVAPALYGATRGQAGLAWHALDLAEARL